VGLFLSLAIGLGFLSSWGRGLDIRGGPGRDYLPTSGKAQVNCQIRLKFFRACFVKARIILWAFGTSFNDFLKPAKA
jgi:hypothetical protein